MQNRYLPVKENFVHGPERHSIGQGTREWILDARACPLLRTCGISVLGVSVAVSRAFSSSVGNRQWMSSWFAREGRATRLGRWKARGFSRRHGLSDARSRGSRLRVGRPRHLAGLLALLHPGCASRFHYQSSRAAARLGGSFTPGGGRAGVDARGARGERSGFAKSLPRSCVPYAACASPAKRSPRTGCSISGRRSKPIPRGPGASLTWPGAWA